MANGIAIKNKLGEELTITLPSAKETVLNIDDTPTWANYHNAMIEGYVYLSETGFWYSFKDFGIQLLWRNSNSKLAVLIPTSTDSIVLGKPASIKLISI